MVGMIPLVQAQVPLLATMEEETDQIMVEEDQENKNCKLVMELHK